MQRQEVRSPSSMQVGAQREDDDFGCVSFYPRQTAMDAAGKLLRDSSPADAVWGFVKGGNLAFFLSDAEQALNLLCTLPNGDPGAFLAHIKYGIQDFEIRNFFDDDEKDADLPEEYRTALEELEFDITVFVAQGLQEALAKFSAMVLGLELGNRTSRRKCQLAPPAGAANTDDGPCLTEGPEEADEDAVNDDQRPDHASDSLDPLYCVIREMIKAAEIGALPRKYASEDRQKRFARIAQIADACEWWGDGNTFRCMYGDALIVFEMLTGTRGMIGEPATVYMIAAYAGSHSSNYNTTVAFGEHNVVGDSFALLHSLLKEKYENGRITGDIPAAVKTRQRLDDSVGESDEPGEATGSR